MATTQHRPHGAFAGPVFGTLEGKTEDTGPTANPITQHRPHGAFTGQRYGTLSGKGASTAATISAATADPTGGTTADIGCTTDTASGALWALVRIGGSPAADSAIEAGGQTAAVSTTTPSIAYTGLTAATGYSVDIVQKVGGVYSNVLTTTFTTDNTGSGGGSLALDTGRADEADTAYSLAITKILATGLAVETDTALDLSLAPPGIVPVGRADETDTAYPLALVKILAMGLAAETDTAIAPDFVATGGGTGATAAQIWGYVMSNGQTAEENVLTMLEYLSDLHLIHGLRAGSPLSVTETERSAGAVVQAISEAAGVVTVTR
ncbi:hypothetical protein [Caldilinea sp.]|uniref:hypothetical protein n=1 Tax=Caldilinea sp. TaxID=2293560 RepID=UPI002C920C9C|nr:hypothetical protein [Caldilinea sp.]